MKVHINHDRIHELKELDDDGSSQVLKSLISLFLNNIPIQIDKLNHAFVATEYVNMKAIAHSICGSSLDLGADTLSSISHRIELHSTEVRDIPSLQEEVVHLKTYFKTVKTIYTDLHNEIKDIPGK